ncbi:phosphoadenosine phosphosulfate reductase family protein [Terasakiella sp.]|uniref:phosphoadenosine phosphosulfate reductase domain-containing protein n=1 Tax=Terasakiella sp. TaxID=2034861 RepID=UPI003AA87089
MENHNVVSVSGGKDSTATLLLAIERGAENISAVFADTGNEHPETYAYIDYLEQKTGVTVRRIKPDFAARIAKKRETVKTKWASEGIPDAIISKALEALKPTGNPFLDLCILKGRFPSRRAQFCTQELKRDPINKQVFQPLLEDPETQDVYSWQGVRADESINRRDLAALDEVKDGLFNYRPILNWTADKVFSFHRKHDVKWNPLYEKGMRRVGCMPCVNCAKSELREIAARFPEAIDRIRAWEVIASDASKRGASTFFPISKDPTASASESISQPTHGIDRMVEWSRTKRGGREMDLEAFLPDVGCSSAYGLCDTSNDNGPPPKESAA